MEIDYFGFGRFTARMKGRENKRAENNIPPAQSSALLKRICLFYISIAR